MISIFYRFIILMGLMLSAQSVQAQERCMNELKPFYSSIESYDNSEQQKKSILTNYHFLRRTIYSTCDQVEIRKFEAAYTEVMGAERKSHFETVSYYPEARKVVDLGEIRDN